MIYNGKRIMELEPSAADCKRRDYVDGIKNYVSKKSRTARQERLLAPDADLRGYTSHRQAFRDMLGIDTFLCEQVPETKKELLGSDDVCTAYRLTVYITEEIPMYAMLLVPHRQGRLPLVIAQHGGGGTPELCSDFSGKNNYNHMVQRILERGAAVILPQLLLWSQTEKEAMRGHDIPYNRAEIDKSLKRFGGSISGLEIAGIIRCIDYALTLPETDADKIGMIGLSYGGYFTLHTMAADERIKAGYSAGVFNDRDVYDWSDWCYHGSALRFQDAEAAALCAPRRLYVAVGKADEVFNYETSEAEAQRAKEYYAKIGAEKRFRFSLWDGGHTVENSDDGYEFIFEAFNGE